MSEDMEVMGCIACMGERKNWCPIHGDGSPAPLGDLDAELGILIANRDKNDLCVFCGTKMTPTLTGEFCPKCHSQVGCDLDFVLKVAEELGLNEKMDLGSEDLHTICNAVFVVIAKLGLVERASSQRTPH